MNTPPYVLGNTPVGTIMLKVLLALVPGIIAYVWAFGSGILITLTLASVAALVFEAIMLKLRRRPAMPSLSDNSALVTAWLLALALPPLAPWWLVVVGTFIAIVIAKQLYGGLGYNPFNPAMVGYAALLISFPVIMTQWPTPLEIAHIKLSFADQLAYIFNRALPDGAQLDAISTATPLDYLKTELRLEHAMAEIHRAPVFGVVGAKGGEIVIAAYLLGGLYLLWQRIVSWHIPVAFLGGLAAIAGIFHLIDPQHYDSVLFHLFDGAAMLCAFFIATDPVSGPTTPKGKLIFAAAIGMLTWVIRTWGGYPDGVAFAVLLMNLCVPLIDAHTQPRVFGHKKS
jgi:electron transport complex protein RnfD